MFMKILAASALAIGLATAAQAQNASAGDANNAAMPSSGAHHHPRRHTRKAVVAPDPTVTHSIGGGRLGADSMNSNADQICPTSPQGASPDMPNASGSPHSRTATSVNGHHCGQ
jgi:hypothetical protein